MIRKCVKEFVVLAAPAGVLVVVAVLAFLNGCSRGNGSADAKPKKGPTVRVELVRQASISRTLELAGEVASVNSVVLAATVEGTIAFCPWREGDSVQRDDTLIEIDREAYRTELLAAQAGLAVATAKLADLKAGTRPEQVAIAEQQVHEHEEAVARIKAEFDRAKTLLQSGGVSLEEFERSLADMKSTEAKLAGAKIQVQMLQAGATMTEIAVQQAVVDQAAAAVEVAKTRLSECVVRAPFDGTLTAVHVRPGDLAVPRIPLLEIVDLSSLVIRFAVPEAHAAAVRHEMPVRVNLDAYPGRTYHATVLRVYPTLDPVMRTRTVEAKLDEQLDLVPGMFARLGLQLETAPNAVIVPQEAILVTPKGQQILFVVRDGTATQRQAVTGIEQDRLVQVIKGVQPGEQVVVAGHERLKDGATVAIAGAGGGGPGGESGGGSKSASGGGKAVPTEKSAAASEGRSL